jgi:hypothetical protein
VALFEADQTETMDCAWEIKLVVICPNKLQMGVTPVSIQNIHNLYPQLLNNKQLPFSYFKFQAQEKLHPHRIAHSCQLQASTT